MKKKTVLSGAFLCVMTLCGSSLQAQLTNNVSNSSFNGYLFTSDAGLNPTLTLYRGVTYIFSIDAIGHPFFIKTNVVTGPGSAYNDGVSNNGTASGVLTFVVPGSAPNQLFYNCSFHTAMHGTINVLNPPAPPTGQIVLITLSPTSVTMQSVGATNWNPIPEYSSNLMSATWAAVPNYTNVLANNTNTTTFNRLDAICGPNVFLRVRNQFP